MESDRDEANLGPDSTTGNGNVPQSAEPNQQPRRRFVGKSSTVGKVRQVSEDANAAEGNGAVQGK